MRWIDAASAAPCLCLTTAGAEENPGFGSDLVLYLTVHCVSVAAAYLAPSHFQEFKSVLTGGRGLANTLSFHIANHVLATAR